MEFVSLYSGAAVADKRRLPAFTARAASAALSLLVLASLYWMGAAAGFSGLIGKWGLNDDRGAVAACVTAQRLPSECDANQYDLPAMFDGVATRPWAYRVLIPWTADLADRYAHGPVAAASATVGRFLGERRLENFSPSKTFAKTTGAGSSRYQSRYAIVYYICFLSIFAFMFLMRRVLQLLGYSAVTCAMAPLIFTIAWPYLMTVNGHYYDASELMFMALAMLCALSPRSLWLPVVAVLGSLNKESFIVFVVALTPFYLGRGKAVARAMLSFSVVLCVAENLVVRRLYSGLPGSAIEWHFLQNIRDYSSPWIYHQAELTYGVVGPQGVFLGSILVTAYICAEGWRNMDRRMKQHVLVSAALNIPLLLLFCISGELRNLSFLFIGFVVLMAQAFENRLQGSVSGSMAATTATLAPAEPGLSRTSSPILVDGRA